MSSVFRIISTAILLFLVLCCGSSVSSVHAEYGFRSACLGPKVWSPTSISDVQQQLNRHFEVVIKDLESDVEQKLLLALAEYETQFGSLEAKEREPKLAQLRKARQRQIELLLEYKDRGQFPQNEIGKTAKPIFVDSNGTHCAVGYLMHRAGDDSLVQSIVDQDNFVLIEGITDDSALAWIASSGLTIREAAMIQPAYPPPPIQFTLDNFQDPEFEARIDGMAVSDLSLSTASFFSETNNLDFLLSEAIFEVDVFGMPFPFLDSFGIGLGCSVFETDGVYYVPKFPTWAIIAYDGFNGNNLIEPGDNFLVHRIRYSVSDASELVRAVNFADVPLFNFNEGSARIASFVSSSNGELIGDGFINTMAFYGGEFDLNVHENEFVVTTYVLELDVDFMGSTFKSLFNEFQREDGPAVIGDMNKDRSVDLLDVRPFVDAIGAEEYNRIADINDDFYVDLLDVSLFVDLLVGNGS